MIKPMLAKNFEEHKHKLKYPVFVQPKLDGIRALWHDGELWTRGEKTIKSCDHIKKLLLDADLPYNLDGEILDLQGKFDESSGLARRQSGTERELSYAVFDFVEVNCPQGFRIQELRRLFNRRVMDSAFHLTTALVYSEPELMIRFREHLRSGFEGTIIRVSNAPYQQKRTDKLLKLKPWLYAIAAINGSIEGKGKHEGRLGALQVVGEDFKSSKVGTGFSDDEREKFWTTLPIFIIVKYQERTLKGSLRFPSFVREGCNLTPEEIQWNEFVETHRRK